VLLFRDRFQQVRLPFARRHAVVVGLGEMGLAFAEAMRRAGDTVVGIERDASHPNIVVARAEGIIVVIGDARERAVLSTARLRRARHLVVTTEDAIALEVLVVAKDQVAGHEGPALDCLAHSTDAEVCALLQRQMLESARDGRFRVDFFNYYDQAARLLLRREPPDADYVVVVGAGALADSVGRTASTAMGESSYGGSGPLVVVGPDASKRAAALRRRHRITSRPVDLQPMDLDLDAEGVARAPILAEDSGRAVIYVCDERSEVNVAVTLALKPAMRRSASRLVVCSDHADGLSILFARPAKQSVNVDSEVVVVRLGAEICTRELVEEGIFEIIARSTHAAYVRARRLEGDVSPVDESMRRWAELPETLRASNRAQAAHVGAKLDAIGCGLVPLDGTECDSFAFASGEIERLARMEHARWVAERQADGWKRGVERDPIRKRSPYLVEWGDLPESIRDRDRETIVQLPIRLRDAGYEIVRLTEVSS
jgi:voltage-gated potassium channel Kch